MRSRSLQHSILRSLPVVAAVMAFAACGAGDDPLGPSTEPAASPSAVNPGAPDNLTALISADRIAWISYRTGWMELFKMDNQGGSVSQLTSLKTTLQGVSWSWDNKKLATVRYRAIDLYHGHNDIWVINADGTNGHWARAQTSAWDFGDPSWSPDGSRIVMTVYVGGTTKTLGWLEPATGKAGLFWYPGGGAVLGWQPSYNKAGTKIIFVGPTGFTVEQIYPDGSGHKVRISADAWISHPQFSPEGARIAYQKGVSPGNVDIYVKNFSTGVTTRLTSVTAVDAFPSWSPDGTKLAFMSDRSGKDQIYTMSAATGVDVLRITNTSATEWAPVWSH
jgi:Tol biopolymer transport system component